MTPLWYTRPLMAGMSGGDVMVVQRRLGWVVTGTYDDETAACVRGVQRQHGYPQTGIVDGPTAEIIGERSAVGQTPDWWDTAERDQVIESLIGDSNAVRRLQSSLGMLPTGRVDKSLATYMADHGRWPC